ncbi:MAG: PilZ domain-containing protein [Syntrophobacteraceae bacterium]
MKKLPIIMESEVLVCSLEDRARKTRSKILGGRHGDFLLMEEPVFRVNERLIANVQGDLLLSFLYEEEEYSFATQILQVLPNHLVLVEYPRKFKVSKVREHHRIQVDLQARLYIEQSKEIMEASIKDISEGGCQLTIVSMPPLAKNMACRLDFSLPNKQNIAGLNTLIRVVRYVAVQRVTELGLQFLGPAEQLDKVVSFCRYCMFFRV